MSLGEEEITYWFCYHRQNRHHLGKGIEFIANQNQSRTMRSKTSLKNAFHFTPPSFLGPTFSLPVTQGERKWRLWSISTQAITHCSCCYIFLRESSSPAPVESLSHRRQFSMNFSSMSPPHKLQLTNCSSMDPFPWAAALQEQTAPL